MRVDNLSLSRRDVLVAGAAGAAAWTAIPGWARKQPPKLARGGAFTHGVSSGMPGRSSVALWTRLDQVEGPSNVRVEIAADPAFERIVHRGYATARPGRDFTVHANVHSRRLRAGREYFYRFETQTAESEVGRFRTLAPIGSAGNVRIGLWTCQHYIAGYFTPHRALATEDVDLVICLGDYIYEYGEAARIPGREDTIGANGDGTAVALDDYRAKYRLYRSDADLRALQARHAHLYIWDDHEVLNNYWRDGAAGDAIDGFAQRRAAGYRAWFEHQPVRRIDGPGGSRIYRSLRLGQLVDLFMIDDRQYRDAQPCGDSNLTPCADAGAPGRTMLGVEQKAWLKDAMRRSPAAWKVLVNGDMLMGLDTPAPGSPKFVDTWDGYAAEREELVSYWLKEGIENVVVVTGDDHDNYAGIVTTTGHADGVPGAVEFVVPSVTSDNTSELIGGSDAGGVLAEQNARSINKHLTYVDQRHHGYCVLEATAEALTVDFKHTASRTDPASEVSTAARFRVPRGQLAVEAL